MRHRTAQRLQVPMFEVEGLDTSATCGPGMGLVWTCLDMFRLEGVGEVWGSSSRQRLSWRFIGFEWYIIRIKTHKSSWGHVFPL